jgi:predicted NBD/HSP70 family sugar kinase
MATTKVTARDLRRNNRSAILRTLYFGKAANRLDLGRRTGLSTATVTNVITELLAEGSVVEAGVEESQGGRPRAILRINPRHGYFVGIDVGENVIRMEIFDLTLQRIGDTQVHPVAGLSHPQQVVDLIAAGIDTLVSAAGILPEAVIGVGIGVPGIVNQSTSVTVIAPSIGWREVPLLAMLEQRLPYLIFLDNGVKAMAQAEALVGAGRGVQHFAAVLIGTGVGAGIIADGSLYRGATNSAGEWGHTKIVLDGRPCRCGSSGCLEAYVGASALIGRWRDLDPQGASAPGRPEEEAIDALVSAAAGGSPIGRQILSETTHYLAVGIANLINLCNPQRIVLGGWVGMRLGPAILPELRRAAEQLSLQPPFRAVTIGLCRLGQDAVALGSATLALESFLAAGGKTPLPIVRVGAGTD